MRTKYVWIKNCELLCVVIVLKPMKALEASNVDPITQSYPSLGRFHQAKFASSIPGDPTLQHAWIIMMPNASQSLKDRFPGIPFQYVT